jgi:hypothetical protein
MSIIVVTQQPSVAVLAVVNLALVIGHLGLRGTNQWQPDFVPCWLPALRNSFSALADLAPFRA